MQAHDVLILWLLIMCALLLWRIVHQGRQIADLWEDNDRAKNDRDEARRLFSRSVDTLANQYLELKELREMRKLWSKGGVN